MKEVIPFRAKLYTVVLSSVAIFVVYFLLNIMDWNGINWYAFALFLTLTILSDSFPVKLPNGLSITVSFAITFASILLFQPFLVVIINVFGDMLSLRKGRGLFKYSFNAAQLAITSGVAALVFNSIYPLKLNFTVQYFIASLIALFVSFIINSAFVTLIIAFVQNEKPYNVWLTTFKFSAPSFLCMAPLGLLIALIYINADFWGLVLFLVPLLLARHSFQSYMSIRQTFFDTIQSLSVAIDAKDPYTRGHSVRVADYAVSLAREMKWPEDKIEFFRYIALIHDVGKIAIPEAILKKEGSLTYEEYDKMKYHSVAGSEIIKDIKFFSEGTDIIKHHHERWDGTGYPEGLKGEQIPMGARILFVADAYDAMTSDRPYRKALSPLTALQEIREGAGTQFDPRVVEVFMHIFPEISKSEKSLSPVQALYGELAAADREAQLHP